MKKNLILGFISITSLFFYCCGETSKSTISPQYDNKINFANLEIGQKSVYKFIETDDWYGDSAVFYRTTDTMMLQIIAKDENGFKVELKYNTNKFGDASFCLFEVKGDYLTIKALPNTNRIPFILSNYDSDSITTIPLYGGGLPQWKLNKWLIPQKVPFGMSYGYPENVKLNGATYYKVLGNLNNSATVQDGPTLVKLYSKESGFISLQILGTRPANALIWNLIP
jgi:hypothetical protein